MKYILISADRKDLKSFETINSHRFDTKYYKSRDNYIIRNGALNRLDLSTSNATFIKGMSGTKVV